MNELPLNKIIQGDCLEILKCFPEESIDCVVTDPPYGDGDGYGRYNKEILNNEDESINYKVLPELERVVKRGGVIYFFTNWKFTNKIQEFVAQETKLNVRAQLVIVKNNFGMGYGFRNQYELCLVFEKGKVVYNDKSTSNVLYMENINHTQETHPHEKGVNLLTKLLLHSTKENDIVLDCFAGSGSTLVACKNNKRNFIGIELDERYCKITQERLDALDRQPDLFDN